MKKLPFFVAIIMCIWANFSLNTSYAWAKKISNQIKFVKLNNLNNSSLEVFVNDDDLIQNISTKNAELNLSFNASSLINNTLLPTSFKIEIYDVTTDRRLLGIFRPSILDERQVSNFKTNIELVNLTKSSNLEINIYNTKNSFFASYNASIVIENQSGISFTELEAADCTGQFGKCQLEYIFQNIHFTTLPSKGLKTKIEQNTDGSYSVNLPLIRGKKNIKVKNIFGNANGSSGNQNFDFDFDGSNLFVIKDGVTTLVAAQGPAGKNGDSGAAGPKGDDGSFSGGNNNINGTLTFVTGGKLQDAILNGTSLVTTNNLGEIPLIIRGAAAQTANLQEWQNSAGTTFASISSAGGITANNLSGTNTGDQDLSSYATTAAVAAGYQPLDADLTSIAALTTTTFGQSLLTQTDAATVRTTIGAGTSSFDGVYSSLSGIPSTFAPTAHQHAGSDITSGTVDPARLGSGSSITTKFLRGDSTWQTITAGDAQTANPLSQFAATTSAQLAGVINDKTGSGALVFANSPTLVTPNIGAATGTSLKIGPTANVLIDLSADTTSGILSIKSTNAGSDFDDAIRLVASKYSRNAVRINNAGNAFFDFGVNAGNYVISGGNQILYQANGISFSLSSASPRDVVFSRNAAGVAQIGTLFGNALGSLLLTNLTASGDIEITDPTRGIILRSPNGTRWRIQVTNAGTLTTTSL